MIGTFIKIRFSTGAIKIYTLAIVIQNLCAETNDMAVEYILRCI